MGLLLPPALREGLGPRELPRGSEGYRLRRRSRVPCRAGARKPCQKVHVLCHAHGNHAAVGRPAQQRRGMLLLQNPLQARVRHLETPALRGLRREPLPREEAPRPAQRHHHLAQEKLLHRQDLARQLLHAGPRLHRSHPQPQHHRVPLQEARARVLAEARHQLINYASDIFVLLLFHLSEKRDIQHYYIINI